MSKCFVYLSFAVDLLVFFCLQIKKINETLSPRRAFSTELKRGEIFNSTEVLLVLVLWNTLLGQLRPLLLSLPFYKLFCSAGASILKVKKAEICFYFKLCSCRFHSYWGFFTQNSLLMNNTCNRMHDEKWTGPLACLVCSPFASG